MTRPSRRVVFRVDSSFLIGTGHVMRCLTLADELALRDVECQFVCREHPGNLNELLVRRGFRVHTIPPIATGPGSEGQEGLYSAWLGAPLLDDAYQFRTVVDDLKPDWIVVDHYGINAFWHAVAKSAGSRLMVIDDLADRVFECDLLLNQNLGMGEEAYGELVSSATKLLVGPQYALLRPEFEQHRDTALDRRNSPALKSVLVTLGGIDAENVTVQVLDVLHESALPSEVSLTVVLGAKAMWRSEVTDKAALVRFDTECLFGVGDMASRMTFADLGIGAAGSTSWERCCLGLPTIMLAIAENQIGAAMAIERVGAGIYAGDTSNESWKQSLRSAINEVASSVTSLQSLASNAAKITDGRGAYRVCEQILDHG